MAPLQPQNPAKHNGMLGRFLKKTAGDKEIKELDDDGRPAKRLRPTSKNASPLKKAPLKEIPDSDEEPDISESEEPEVKHRTDLEAALPPVRTDDEAIEEYEARKAAESAEQDIIKDGRERGAWVKGRSSIYVDAFNLALETVLEEESHLFDEPERAVFQIWKDMSYDAQYL